MNNILTKALSLQRLSPEEALFLLKECDWTEVIQVANAVRNKKLPGHHVGYTVYQIINYTNVCKIECEFCSFSKQKGDLGTYVLSLDKIREKAIHAKELGADQIFLQGGVNDEIPITYYINVLQMLTKEQKMRVRGFSPVEIFHIAKNNSLKISELLEQLKIAGLSSVPGAGAEILSDRVRSKLSPHKLSSAEWKNTIVECHRAGLFGSVNIVFGSFETKEEIISHLDLLRSLQDETNGIKSFVAWTFQKQTDRFPIKHVTPQDYLKLLAISRLYLDNIPHIEVSVLGMGKEIGELGLSSGADDINSVVLEENVLESKGIKSIKEAEEFIRNAGFIPYRRSLDFD